MTSLKRPKLKSIRDDEPEFIGKFELAHHLGANISSLNKWIANGTIPPAWFKPGIKHPVWRRDHFEELKRTGSWPRAAFHSRAV
jgi:hypothetical protein